MQTLTISGNLARDAELKSTQGGDKVLSFSVGVKQGYGERASTNWFRVSVWGKRGETLERYLRKGMKVVVQGELSIGEYQGKPQYELRANEVEFMSAGEKQERQSDNRGGGGGGSRDSQWQSDGHNSYDDLGDDVPFATCGNLGGHRNI